MPEADSDRAGMLCERLVELEALGARFEQGQELEADGMSFVATLGGSMEDPEFNNTFVAFRWPE